MNLLQRMLSWIRPARTVPPASPPAEAAVVGAGSATSVPAPGVRRSSPDPAQGPTDVRRGSTDPAQGPTEGLPSTRTGPESDSPWKKGSDSFGLDASDYLPITRTELKDAAKDRNLLNNPWLGRRDVIPPADDPRTRLIDRAMVTQGILTPEQLAEIHAIGAELDRVRLTQATLDHQAARVGEAAVAADREARAEIKARKKAEAAERRRRRAEAVARLKAEDIVFLGRGVSGRLGERAIRIDDLERAGLPALEHARRAGRRDGNPRPAPAMAGVPRRGRHPHALHPVRRPQEERR